MTPLEIIIALCEYLKEHPEMANTPVFIDSEAVDGWAVIDDGNPMVDMQDGSPMFRLAEVRE